MCVLAACHCCHMLRLLASNADAMEPADVGIDGSSGDESTSCVAIDGSGDDEAVDSGSDGSGDERSRASTTSDESSEGSVSRFGVLDTPDDLRVAGAPYLGPELLIDLDSC
ncbi:hypothetical protein BHE74_00003577 [Ensete ventricosum]|nr:hypothetical protein BHE74_00003577 [Ensete ventricosum]